MGLAEQKQKQRIGADPQNSNWSRDTSRFGFKMLERMGWTPGKGLGVNEAGTIQHVKTVVKKDQRGLGFDAKSCDNWLDNTSGFAQLLKKLNETSKAVTKEVLEPKPKPISSDFKKLKNKKQKKNKKNKNKKRANEEICETNSDSNKDPKSEGTPKDKKSKKSKRANKASTSKDDSLVSPLIQVSRLSHRARYVQNKKLSTSDPSVLSAIFGVRG